MSLFKISSTSGGNVWRTDLLASQSDLMATGADYVTNRRVCSSGYERYVRHITKSSQRELIIGTKINWTLGAGIGTYVRGTPRLAI
jgi:hypothetical protein